MPLDRPLPPPEPPLRLRFVKSRWPAFLSSLPADLAVQAEVLIGPDQPYPLFNPEVWQFRDGLSKEQDNLLDACWQRPQGRARDLHYPSELARRWIAQRTMSLGWTPARFGQFDHDLSFGDEVVICCLPTDPEYHGELLVVREDWLQDYLRAQGLALVLALRGQRDHQHGPNAASWTEFSLSGSYDGGTLSAGTAVIALRSTPGADIT